MNFDLSETYMQLRAWYTTEDFPEDIQSTLNVT